MTTDLLDYRAIAVAMTGLDAGPQQPLDVIDVVSMLDRAINALTGFRAQAIEVGRIHSVAPAGDLAERSQAARSYEAEIACALRISECAAQGLIGVGESLAARLPATLDALGTGDLLSSCADHGRQHRWPR